MQIQRDDLTGTQVRALLDTFWTVWRDPALAGCGALKAIDRGRDQVDAQRRRIPPPRLYLAFGLEACGPFEGYRVDPEQRQAASVVTVGLVAHRRQRRGDR
jgi:hypothetical protein